VYRLNHSLRGDSNFSRKVRNVLRYVKVKKLILTPLIPMERNCLKKDVFCSYFNKNAPF